MRNIFRPALILALAALGHTGVWAATYTFASFPYDPASITNFTSCSSGNCGNFSVQMRQTGSFTTAAPLAANLNNVSIVASVLSFSIFDGLTTYASGDPLTRLKTLTVTTDAIGAVTKVNGNVLRWQQPGPHVNLVARLDMVTLHVASRHNYQCQVVVPDNPPAADNCTSAASDDATSLANPGLASAAAQSVPVDNPFALALGGAAMLGVVARRKNRWFSRRKLIY